MTASGEPSDSPLAGLIRIPDPDAPIHRIFSLWSIEQAIRDRQLTLVAPRQWEDPYETAAEESVVVGGPSGGGMINDGLPQAYAQCWSATNDSDTLLRAYSRVEKDQVFKRNLYPAAEGVIVRSTPRKLLEALKKGVAHIPELRTDSCYVGAVRYLPESSYGQTLASAVAEGGHTIFTLPYNRAALLLMKREAFRHEAEIRVILTERRPIPPERLFRVEIDPNDLFDEVTFDARLEAAERDEREGVIRGVGYSGKVSTSDRYRKVAFEIVIPASINAESAER